jgi:hypothetical protein
MINFGFTVNGKYLENSAIRDKLYIEIRKALCPFQGVIPKLLEGKMCVSSVRNFFALLSVLALL